MILLVDILVPWLVYGSHVCCGVLGSLRCSWLARSASVAFMVDSAMSRLLCRRGLFPLCILADIASTFDMKLRVCSSVVVRLSSSGVQLFTTTSHMEARCLSSRQSI